LETVAGATFSGTASIFYTFSQTSVVHPVLGEKSTKPYLIFQFFNPAPHFVAKDFKSTFE